MGHQPLTILEATEVHLAQVAEIYNQAIDRGFCTAHTAHLKEDYWTAWLERQNASHPIMVGMIGDKVVGWYSLNAYRNGREALSGVRELSFYINENFQGAGIGKEMIAHAIDKAITIGVENLLAIVLEKNITSIGILKRFNFQLWGLLPDVANFHGERCSHLYFGLNLNPDQS